MNCLAGVFSFPVMIGSTKPWPFVSSRRSKSASMAECRLTKTPFFMARLVFRSYIILLLLLLFSCLAHSYSTIKYLPGFQGPLPFELETGYVGVGDSEEVQLFYYFIKSEGDPQKDPLILWHIGGPGCSALSGVAIDMGPLNFKIEPYNGSLPTLVLNPYSWTKRSSMIFIDLPVGTGFSYAKTPQARKTGDLNQAHHSHQFLRKWLIDHPEFISNPFYVGGDSYAGLIVPIVVQEIINENKHTLPFVNLQGYIMGNPLTIRNTFEKFAISFAHRMTLISDELFESLERSCNGDYGNIDRSDVECLKHYNTFKKSTSRINREHILLPYCLEETSPRRSLQKIPNLSIEPEEPFPSFGCPMYVHVHSYHWANNDQVRKALHIRKGSIGEWIRCNRKLDYERDIDSALPYHINISSKGLRSLVYSGDHDMEISHMDTQAWIKLLNYSIVDDWRPWFIADQVAGYTRTYANKMTFVTIKGGGHTAYIMPKECDIMFSRWISGESL